MFVRDVFRVSKKSYISLKMFFAIEMNTVEFIFVFLAFISKAFDRVFIRKIK